MKKALTLLMLALSLATFAQDVTKVVILDTYNKGGKLSQSTLVELKTNLAQTISETYGFEGVIDKKVDFWLLAEGFAEHPRLSEEQVKQVANLSGTPYAIMSEASIDDFGYISLKTLLINLDVYQVMVSESTSMNNTAEQIHKGCEKLVKKVIVYLPKPEMPIVEEKPETVEQLAPSEPLPTPQQLTSKETEDVTRLLNHADVCIEMNYIDEAIKKYEEIVAIAPGWANVYMYLGNTYASKGDAASLKKAKENYQKFMLLTDDQDLYFEAQDKLSRIEMMVELKGREDEKVENLVGTWKTTLHNKYTGQPFFILNITKTPEPNKYQITVSPKSLMYNNIVNTKAYAEIIDGRMGFSYTFQETYIPSQSKYNIAGATVNYLFGNSLAGALGGAVVETLREGDVGYTNIMDFDFITEVDIKDDLYKMYSDAYMNGSCHFKGEHHQAGRSNVELDTIYECALLQGGDYYPVFEKIKNIGGDYYYGNIKLGGNNSIIDYSPYISRKEYEDGLKGYKTGIAVSATFLSISGGLLLGGLLVNGVYAALGDPAVFGSKYFVINGVVAGASIIGCIASVSSKRAFFERCYSKHNQQVDENIRKLMQNDQASVSFGVGLSSTGVGVYLNF